MAVLTPANVITTFITAQPNADITGLYGLRNVSTGDTIDVTTLDPPHFQVIKRAVVIGVSDFVEIAASFTNTVVTMPSGLNQSSGYLLLWGCLDMLWWGMAIGVVIGSGAETVAIAVALRRHNGWEDTTSEDTENNAGGNT